MNKIYTLFLSILFPAIIFSQSTAIVSEAISVTNNNSTFGKHLPRINSLSDGTIVVMWSKAGSNPGIYMSKKDENGFGDVIEVPTGSLQPDIWSGALGPGFAIFENTIFVVFEIWGQGIYCVRSTDGGINFEDPVTAYDPPDGRSATLPAVSVTSEGNPVIGFITTNLSEQDARYETVVSNDGGMTFGLAVVASEAADGDEVCECCPTEITVTPEDEIYISFRNNNANTRDIWISYSADLGQTYPSALDMDETNWYIQGCPSTGPDSYIFGDTLVTVFFSSAEGWESGIYSSTLERSSSQTGETVKLPHFAGNSNLQNYPRIAGSEDTLGIVWHENTGDFNNIAFVWSVNGTGGLSDEALNISNASHSQVFPDIHYANGMFHIVYEDQATATVLYQTVHFETATGIIEPIPGEPVLIPNPARNTFSISTREVMSGQFNLEIIDITGRLVMKSPGTNLPVTIDISGIDPGIYIVRLSGHNMHFSSRLLKD